MTEHPPEIAEARWRRLSQADALGVPLSSADRAFLDGYTPRSAVGRAEAELLGALEQLGHGDATEHPDDDALVRATVQHVMAARSVACVTSQPPVPRRRPWVLVASLASLAAAGLVGWMGLRALSTTSEAEDPSSLAEAHGPGPEAPAPASAPTVATDDDVQPPSAAQGFVIASGRLVDDTGRDLPPQLASSGALRVESERGCIDWVDVHACFDQGSRLELSLEEPGLVVVEGEGIIETTAPLVAVMMVEVAGDRYSLSGPVVIHTTVHGRDDAEVEVVEGRIELVDASGQSRVLEAGQVRGGTASARTPTSPDAKTLLERARASRAAGDRSAAISHYERLLRLHPRAPASQAAMVSLGDLYLETGKPASALRWFDRYLRKGGPLAQEAHLGRIKALGALGRGTEEQRAIEAFRRRYPSSRYADQLGGPSPR
ncbi:MAG: tetratricopeptide repeat protein [Myxococcales bacterium]|nr:tetratricopeptide repeat protein [Myxococcales bacterium]